MSVAVYTSLLPDLLLHSDSRGRNEEGANARKELWTDVVRPPDGRHAFTPDDALLRVAAI